MSENLTPWQQYKKNLGDARPWDLMHKDQQTDEKTANERYEICKKCPEFINLTTQCKKCGCIMTLKTKLKIAECPLGKWGQVDVKIDEGDKNAKV